MLMILLLSQLNFAIRIISDTCLFVVIPVMGISKSCISLMLVIAGRLGSYKYLNKLRDATMPPMVCFFRVYLPSILGPARLIRELSVFRSKYLFIYYFPLLFFWLLPFSKYLNLFLCLFFSREKEYGAINSNESTEHLPRCSVRSASLN